MKWDKIKNIILIIFSIIIIGLIIVIIAMAFKNEYLQDRYDDLEDKYEYLYKTNIYNPNNNDNNYNNSEDKKEESNTNKNISKDEALALVLKDLNITQNKINNLDIELNYKVRYDKIVYEIDFDYKGFEYEYYLDPVTGKILDSFKNLD